MPKKKPDKLYAFWANTSGPWYDKPRLVKYNTTLDSWWDTGGNADTSFEGLEAQDGYVAFAHRDKKEVQKFMDGFNACRKLLSPFFTGAK